MRVEVLGGGPAGLYAALLLKQIHPEWSLTVHERNPRDATYGWGVVFSDRTLTGLREADFRTYDEITGSFVLWEAINADIHGTLLRCEGHAFAGIGRRHLLNILQDRCEELGVALRFEIEVDPAGVTDADLLIAADGVNSRTRSLYEPAFGPSVTMGRARYIWFGVDKTYDSFTFIFKENEHGLHQVHAYPFNGTTSTFIVECDEAVWLSAGLDQADEAASLAYCEALFAEHLAGSRLMSNRSAWLSFPTLTTRRWSHDSVVILGDAAHTAHFSIGSGTKLALEDAIALAQAFEQTIETGPALRRFELSRRPRVEATQRAAEESRRYFEELRRYRHFEPRQFMFHLLTRSGRITYDNLRQRDPRFVDETDLWFRSAHDPRSRSSVVAPPPLHTPLVLGGAVIPNRAVMAPEPSLTAVDGLASRETLDELRQIASGSAGIVMLDHVAVAPDGRVSPVDIGLYDRRHAEVLSSLVTDIDDDSGARLLLSLAHAGRRGSTRPRSDGVDRSLRTGGWPLISASALPYAPGGPVPRAMTDVDMDRVREQFAGAARLALEAGVGVLQIDMSRGYLLASFISPLTNRRDDVHNGSLENRLRFPLSVLDAVRAVWPDDRPLAVALTASDQARGGARLSDAVAVVGALRDHGCDLITVHSGQTVYADRPNYDFDTAAHHSDIIRNEARIPTLTTAFITTTNPANTLLAGGRCDLCLLRGPHPPAPSPRAGRREDRA
ncbi:MAG TPA: FAD-dependent monooxygenase [Thermomicrobiales bacterium]|nr:FAD-dependent monooxygenase [Thermomicrobiales bacterium]